MIFITKDGQEKLSSKVKELENELRKIRDEKAIAYSSSGDGWHDNPGFNQLEQKEHLVANNLNKILQKLQTSIVVDNSNISTEKVQIGCIVEFDQIFVNTNKTDRIVFEIVGHEESDIAAKKIAYDSPLGYALLGLKINDEKYTIVPKGKVKLKILKIYRSWEDFNK